MKNALILLLVVALAAGGYYYWYQGQDTRYARQVLDCLYAGSLEPLKDTMSPEAWQMMENPRIKAQLPQAAAQLKNHFGEIKTLKFKSEGPFDAAYARMLRKDGVKKTWTATSDKGTFEWTLYFDKEGKLLTMTPGQLTPL